jgi:hypothetical protein
MRGNGVLGLDPLISTTPISHHPALTITDELCRPNNPQEQKLTDHQYAETRAERKGCIANDGDFSMRWHFPPRYGKMDAFHSSQSPKSAETSENGVSGSQFVLKAATSFRPRL